MPITIPNTWAEQEASIFASLLFFVFTIAYDSSEEVTVGCEQAAAGQ